MPFLALPGLLTVALQAAPAPPMRAYIVVGAEDCEVLALDKGSVRPVSPGIVDGALMELTCSPREVRDAGGKLLGEAAYNSSVLRANCRKQTYSPIRTTYYREDGSVLHVRTYPPGEEGWLHEATTAFVRLACSERLRKRHPVKNYATTEDFLSDVRKSFQPPSIP